jgi:hypothetical protein
LTSRVGAAGGRSRSLLDRTDALALHQEMGKPSQPSPRKSAERLAREERLTKALRDNLRRRKEQARARELLAIPQSEQPAKGRERGDGEPPA